MQPAPAPGKRVLVIDDEESLRDLLQLALREGGYAVETARDGLDGLEQLKSKKFDLVLLDVWMPRMNGLELLTELQQLPAPPRVIMMTADHTPETLLHTIRQSAYQYIGKPFTLESMMELVGKAITCPEQAAIEVLSAKPEWVELLVPCQKEAVDRIESFLMAMKGDLAEEVRYSVGQAFHELLLNAIEWGGKLDPNVPNVVNLTKDTAYNPWTKNYFGLRIIPRPDKWYGFDIVDDPRGYTRRVRTVNNAQCGATTCFPNYPTAIDTITTERVLKFSVYIAKRYGPISGRFGILENTGGAGIKLHLANDSLTLSADAWEFANPLKDRPRLKLYADYRFLNHLLLTFGVDDVLNRPLVDPEQTTRIVSGRDYFIGAGVFFNDDDIKMLIAAIPIRF